MGFCLGPALLVILGLDPDLDPALFVNLDLDPGPCHHRLLRPGFLVCNRLVLFLIQVPRPGGRFHLLLA